MRVFSTRFSLLTDRSTHQFTAEHTAGVPQVHHFGQEGLHNVLVIDLLGPNLEDLFDMCGRKFTIKTVCMAAKQMVRGVSRLSVHWLFLEACMHCSELWLGR